MFQRAGCGPCSGSGGTCTTSLRIDETSIKATPRCEAGRGVLGPAVLHDQTLVEPSQRFVVEFHGLTAIPAASQAELSATTVPSSSRRADVQALQLPNLKGRIPVRIQPKLLGEPRARISHRKTQLRVVAQVRGLVNLPHRGHVVARGTSRKRFGAVVLQFSSGRTCEALYWLRNRPSLRGHCSGTGRQ